MRVAAADVIRQVLTENELEFSEPGPGRFTVDLPGERKLKTTVMLTLGEQALSVHAFVARQPDENHHDQRSEPSVQGEADRGPQHQQEVDTQEPQRAHDQRERAHDAGRRAHRRAEVMRHDRDQRVGHAQVGARHESGRGEQQDRALGVRRGLVVVHGPRSLAGQAVLRLKAKAGTAKDAKDLQNGVDHAASLSDCTTRACDRITKL